MNPSDPNKPNGGRFNFRAPAQRPTDPPQRPSDPTQRPGVPTPRPGAFTRTPAPFTRTPAASTPTPAAFTRAPGAFTRTPAASTPTPAASTPTPAAFTRTPAAFTRTPAAITVLEPRGVVGRQDPSLPRFVTKMEDVSIPLSNKLRLECTFTGAPQLFVTWYKDGKQLYASYRYNTKVTGNTCSMECLHECNKDTPGKYSCEVSNAHGTDICHAQVTVVTEPARFVTKLKDISIPMRQKLKLECTFKGAPKMFVTWYKNGKQLYASYRYNTKVTGNSCTVECLHECNKDTPGTYACEVTNSYGTEICYANVSVVTEPARFVKKLKDLPIALGQKLILECHFKGAPKMFVTWYKDGKQLYASYRYNTKVTANSCILESLHGSKPDTAGRYSCEVSNTYGTEICHAEVVVGTEPARFVTKLKDHTIPMSKRLTLECTFTGTPKMFVTWYKEGKQVYASYRYNTKVTKNSCILECLHPCNQETSGMYSCEVGNAYGTDICHAKITAAKDTPEFVTKLKDLSIPMNNKLKLECTFQGAPKMFVTWYKDGKQLYASYRYNTKTTPNSCVLECLHECNEKTTGRYSCEISNKSGSIICHAQVTAVTEPARFVTKLADLSIPLSQKLRLVCTFTGAPKMFVTWYKDNKQLYASYRYNTKVIGNSCIMECLHECNKETTGKYSCEVTNKFGSDMCHAEVTTVPDCPQFVKELPNIQLCIGKKLTLKCTFTGAPKMFVTWYKDGKQLYASYRHNTKLIGNSCIVEALHGSNKETAGRYSCEISNSHGLAICHADITVGTDVAKPPTTTEPQAVVKSQDSSQAARFVMKMGDVSVPMRSNLRLECRFTGAPKLFVTWYKDGKQLYASYRYNTKVIGNTCSMECLHECNKDTPGKYSCEVSNAHGTDVCHAQVTVVTEPARFVTKLKDVSIPMRQKLRLECTFKGAPKMFVTWYKNGKQLYASYRYNTKVTGNTCTLECLHECNKNTPGIYACEVSNSYGTEFCYANVSVITEPARFVKKLKDLPIALGQKLILECHFKGAPKMFVTWYKDGKQLYASYRHNTKVTANSCILESLHGSKPETAGRYSCEVSNTYGTDICHAEVVVATEPARFVTKLKDHTIPMSKRLTLECTFTGAQKMFVTWYKEGKQVYASYRYNTKVTKNSCILECLHPCNQETSGIYSCEVSNAYGTDICHAQIVSVTEPPTFVTKLKDLSVPMNNKLKLECTFKGAQKMFVTWYKDGKQLYASYRYNTKTTQTSCVLECLHECNDKTTGRYSCEVTNKYGSDTCYAQVTAVAEPASFVKKLADLSIPLSQKLRLECTFTGPPKMFVTWYKDNKQLYASYRYNTKVIGNSCILECLHECNKETTGKYSCEVTNKFGSDICHAQVTTVPDCPQFVKKLPSIQVYIGEKMTLKCTFTGAKVFVTWYKDGKQLYASYRHNTKLIGNSCIVEALHGSNKETAGRYSCEISNSHGLAICHADITVGTDAPHFVKKLKHMTIQHSKMLRLECSFTGAQKVSVTWYKDGKELNGSSRYNTNVTNNSCVLESLLGANKDTTGKYSCEISNAFGTAICHAQITAESEAARFVKKLQDLSIPLSQNLTLECTFMGAPKMVVNWYKDGKQLLGSYNYITKVTENSCLLECTHECDKETAGRYSCEISNPYGTEICHAHVTPVTEPARFVKKLKDVRFPLGKNLQLECTFKGAPEMSVLWYKDGKQVYASDTYNTKVIGNTCVLEGLHGCNKDTAGRYTCEVTNAYGRDTCHAQVATVTEPGRLVTKLKDHTIPMSQKLRLECTFTGAPKMFVTWYKDGKQVYGSYKYNTKVTGNTCVLECLHESNKDTTGKYSCEVYNAYGSDICHAQVKAVTEPAHFVMRLQNITVPMTEKLRLQCTFTGAPKMFVTWYKDGKQLYASYRHNTKVTRNSCILEALHPCNKDTSGRYSCEVSNSHGTDICHAQVIAVTEPVRFVKKLQNAAVPMSQKLRLECTFTGAPKMFVTWYKDGKQLYASYRHNTKIVGNACILEALHPCNGDTPGIYSCEVSNSYGTVICHAEVNTAPDTPRFTKMLTSRSLKKGEKLHLKCSFTGAGKMFVTWYKDGKQVYGSYRYNTTLTGNSCVLEALHESNRDTAGRYSCEISNSYGRDSCDAQINFGKAHSDFI